MREDSKQTCVLSYSDLALGEAHSDTVYPAPAAAGQIVSRPMVHSAGVVKTDLRGRMFNVILYQPEIPPNTGNIIRLCANSGARLHLVKPLGFTLEDKQLLRAGLDYHEFATLTVHESWADCAESFKDHRLFAVSTKGTQRYDLVSYADGDVFVFGPESRGLPPEILGSVAEQHRIRVPMVAGNRSLNLSNSVAVVIYEAWRQVGFVKGK